MKVYDKFGLSFQNDKSVISMREEGTASIPHPHSPTVFDKQKPNPVQSFSLWLKSLGWCLGLA